MRLSDLCDLITVQVDPRERPNDVYVGLEHIAPGRLVRTGEGRGAEVQSPKYVFRAGDILYGKLRPYLNKAVLVEDNGLCTTELLVLRPKAGVDPRFVVSVVHAPAYVKHAIAGTTGVQHPRTSWEHISNFTLPPLSTNEQTKVVELLWPVHKAIYTNEKTINAGIILMRAVMRVLFMYGLRNEASKETEIGPIPESWKISTVAEATKPFHFERSKQIPKSGYAEVGKWPIIDQGREFLSGYTDDETRIIRSKEPLIIFGDHTRILKYVDFECALGADGTKPLLAKKGFISKYLYHALSNLDLPARGYNRHYTILKEMKIAKPEISEQNEIIDVLDAIDCKINLHIRKRKVLEDLFNSLLDKFINNDIANINILMATNADPLTSESMSVVYHSSEI